MRCKNCGKEVMLSLYRLRSFCSDSCRTEFRKKHLKGKKMPPRRTVMAQDRLNNKGGYVNTYPQGISGDQKIDYTEYGGLEWYELAKECCNFEVRKNEGYCVTLHEPYFKFRKRCCDCLLGKALGGSKRW